MSKPQPKETNHPEYVIEGDAVIRLSRHLPLWDKHDKPLPIACPSAFRCIAGRWFTDGVHIIVQAQHGSDIAYEFYYRIEDADLATFEVLNERYARDARQAYYIRNKTIRTRSPHAFRPLAYDGWRWSAEGPRVPARRMHEYIAVDAESVYLNGRRIVGADGATVVGFEDGYLADAQHVYYYGRATDLDRASFICGLNDYGRVAFTDRFGPIKYGKRETALDRRIADEWRAFFTERPELHDYWWHALQQPPEPTATIEFRGKALTGLDSASFASHELEYGYEARGIVCGDAHGMHWLHEYSEGTSRLEPISDQPIAALRVLGRRYFTDGVAVFYTPNHYETPRPLSRTDPADFQVLTRGWARDSSRAFYLGVVKKGVDPERLQLEGCYAWDGDHLFCDGKPLKVDAPYAALEVPHPLFLRAGDKLFCGRRPVSTKRVHLPTLEFVGDDFARDHKHVYVVTYEGLAKVDGADPSTFRMIEPGIAQDETHRYDAQALRKALRA